MEARILEDPATGNPCGKHRKSQAQPSGPFLRAGAPRPHLPSPPVIGDVAVHEPAGVVRHPADDIDGHDGSCRTVGEGQSDREQTHSVTLSLQGGRCQADEGISLDLVPGVQGSEGNFEADTVLSGSVAKPEVTLTSG